MKVVADRSVPVVGDRRRIPENNIDERLRQAACRAAVSPGSAPSTLTPISWPVEFGNTDRLIEFAEPHHVIDGETDVEDDAPVAADTPVQRLISVPELDSRSFGRLRVEPVEVNLDPTIGCR